MGNELCEYHFEQALINRTAKCACYDCNNPLEYKIIIDRNISAVISKLEKRAILKKWVTSDDMENTEWHFILTKTGLDIFVFTDEEYNCRIYYPGVRLTE
jgi:hypothetical protein